MRKTACIIDERYIDHDASPNHPERPARLETLIELTDGYTRDGYYRVAPEAAAEDDILLNHTKEHFDAVAASANRDMTVFDADTAATNRTYDTAMLAAGGVLKAVDEVMSGSADNAFAVVRPPGHHAEPSRAMGFCFFNNVAIAARHLRERHGVERVLIVDWDVHHGNGTQESFFQDNTVLFVSTHQWPLYPGTGAGDEVGEGGAAGYTVNVPMPAGCGDAEYVEAFQRLIDPIARQFEPGFVLVSAGYDSHQRDPLGSMEVTGEGFASLTSIVLSIADACADGRCVMALEGGYSLKGLADGVRHTLEVMGAGPRPVAPSTNTTVAGIVTRLRQLHSPYWHL